MEVHVVHGSASACLINCRCRCILHICNMHRQCVACAREGVWRVFNVILYFFSSAFILISFIVDLPATFRPVYNSITTISDAMDFH